MRDPLRGRMDLSLAAFARRCKALGMSEIDEHRWGANIPNTGVDPQNESVGAGSADVVVVAEWRPLKSFPADNVEFGERSWRVHIDSPVTLGGVALQSLYYVQVVLSGDADSLIEKFPEDGLIPFLAGAKA